MFGRSSFGQFFPVLDGKNWENRFISVYPILDGKNRFWTGKTQPWMPPTVLQNKRQINTTINIFWAIFFKL